VSGLPNARLTQIDERKVRDYLLSDIHPVSRTKAAFFRRFGFRASAWKVLENALYAHAQTAEVVSTIETDFGIKYIIEGDLAVPSGREPRLRSVWFVPIGHNAPQLVTAYPVPRGDE
jgi:hypothetical protein